MNAAHKEINVRFMSIYVKKNSCVYSAVKKMNPARHQRRAGFGSQTKNVFMRRFLSVLFGQVSLLGLQGRCGHHGIVVSEL